MKKFTFVLILLITSTQTIGKVSRYKIGNMVLEDIPRMTSSFCTKLKRYQNMRSASFRDWLPNDKGMLISTRFNEVYQLHSVETPKGMRQQLTFFNDPVEGGLVCPDPQVPFFLFTKDSAGNEQTQIYDFNFQTGEYQLLTDGKSKCGAIVWSNKGDKFAFSSNLRNGRDFDLYLGELTGEESFRPILQKKGWWGAMDWSADDQRLLVRQYISANESYCYIFEAAKENLLQINPVDQKISYGDAQWSKDGKGVYLVSDQFSDFRQLLHYDLESEKCDILTEQIPWDIEDFELSPSGDTIAFISNEDGISKLYLMDISTREMSPVHLPAGLIYNLKYKPDGTHLAFVFNNPKKPSDVYSLASKNKTLIRWTYSEIGGLDSSRFVEPELIHYETFDSVAGKPRLIPAFYYKPNRFKPPYPVLIDCHGGPEGQDLPTFSPLTQFYLNEMGIAVIAPNIRGSSGYGKEYLMLDNGDKREDAVRDIGALLDWIEKQPELDAKRIAITGGSYGGYMVLASMIHYADRLCCGIDGWGISNFITFLKNTGSYRQDLRRSEYGNEHDPKMREFLNKISPLTNAHKITKPMFVVQGLHDPRVPVSEAEQIVKAIRKNGADVWYLLAEDEGHGFGKKSNRDFYQQTVILFLEEYLLK